MEIATCHTFSHSAYCDAVAAEAERFLASMNGLDPAIRVPTCPDWSVSDLVDHLGTVHRWAAAMVAVRSPERIPSANLDLEKPEDYAGRAAWFTAGAARLVEALRGGDPGAPMWAWGADKHLAFWSRRQLHETAVHRADAEFAAGIEPEIDATVAVDGVDEFLENLPHAAYWAPHVNELHGTGEQIAFRSADAGVTWTVRLKPEAFSWDHSESDAKVTVEGTAADLYLLVWGRRRVDDASRFKVEGDRALLDFWVERSAI